MLKTDTLGIGGLGVAVAGLGRLTWIGAGQGRLVGVVEGLLHSVPLM